MEYSVFGANFFTGKFFFEVLLYCYSTKTVSQCVERFCIVLSDHYQHLRTGPYVKTD